MKEGYTNNTELNYKRKAAVSALNRAKQMEAQQANRVKKHMVVNGKQTVVSFIGDNTEEKFNSFCEDININLTTFNPSEL